MMRRRALVAALHLTVVGALLACNPPPRRLAIIHTSDVHGGLAARPARWHQAAPDRLIGGYAVLARLIQAQSHPTLALDSGDIFQGTPEGNLSRGQASIAAMNATGFHAMAIGNHEFDYGEENLRALVQTAQFPVLAANINVKATGEPVDYAKPAVLLNIDGIQVGIIGVATQHTRTSTLPENVAHLDFTDEVAAARFHAEALRAQGADVIVALSHCGLAPSVARQHTDSATLQLTDEDLQYHGDLAIARGAPVDLVLGGHLHTGLSHPWVDPESGVIIVQSYAHLEAATQLLLRINSDGSVQLEEGELVQLWVDQWGEDDAVKRTVEQASASVSAALDEVIGHTDNDLLRAPGTLDTPLGNWASDAMRAATEADIAIQNTYGLRADLYAGDIRVRDVYQVMPFDNTLVVVDLSAAQLEQLVRDNLRAQKSRIQVAGISIWTDGHTIRLRVDGEPLDPERTYRVVTNNYLTQGGTGGGVFADTQNRDTGRSVRDALMDAVRRDNPLQTPDTGRIQWVKAE